MILAFLSVTTATAVVPPETAYGHIAMEVIEAPESTFVSYDAEKIVRSYFRDIPIMIEVARCESTFRHQLADGSVLTGRVDPADTAVMQISKRYHESTARAMNLDLNDIYHNMAYARFLYETQGTQPWSASAFCWNKSLAANI